MKAKLIFSMIFISLLSVSAYSQFNMSTGGGILFGKGKLPEGAEYDSERPSILGYGIFLYPRYNVVETEGSAVSIGIPATLGLSGSVNSRSGGAISITADLPMTFDYNFGARSSQDNESAFGGFIGAGFGYMYSNQSYEYYNGMTGGYEQVKGSSYGPLAHAGVKLLVGDRCYFLRGSYKIGLEKEKYKTVGVSFGVSL